MSATWYAPCPHLALARYWGPRIGSLARILAIRAAFLNFSRSASSLFVADALRRGSWLTMVSPSGMTRYTSDFPSLPLVPCMTAFCLSFAIVGLGLGV